MEPITQFFDLAGTITRIDKEIIGDRSDSETIYFLDENRYIIERDIREAIYKTISQVVEVKNLNVNLSFERGSILVSGLVVIDLMGKVSGAIAFFEYLAKLIKRVTEHVIRRTLARRGSDFDVQMTVVPISISEMHRLPGENSERPENLFNIPSSQLLISITLINIMFFIGGTLFNLFQVDSVQKRYNEANQKYLEVKTKYDSASQLLDYAKIKYQGELESIIVDVIQRKNSIMSKLSSDTINISSALLALDSKARFLEKDLGLIRKVTSDNQKLQNDITDRLNKLQQSDIKFGIKDIWQYMDLTLRAFFIVVVVIVLLVIVWCIAAFNSR